MVERHGVDPLEMAHDAIHQASRMIAEGYATQGRAYFRRQLEAIIRYMCPECGRTDDHEDAEHRFVASRELTLGEVLRGRG